MKYALVTGGSRGIGRAVSLKLSRMGYKVLINYVHNAAEAKNTLDQVRLEGGDGEILMFDVADRQQVSRALEAWEAEHPDEYIEVLVNNAGIRRDHVMALMPEEDWSRVLEITLNGFFHVTQALLPAMQLHKNGRIVNVASVTGLKGMAGQSNYAAAKGGLIAARTDCRHQVVGAGGCPQTRHCQRRGTRFHPDGHAGGAGRGRTEKGHPPGAPGHARRGGRAGGLLGLACGGLHHG